jgi:hypothetical protein
MKAITKEDLNKAISHREFPDYIIQAFNECITESKIKHSDRVGQNQVMDRVLKLNPSITQAEVFKANLLDVEDYYRNAGWTVEYYKPPYYDDSEPYFTFK